MISYPYGAGLPTLVERAEPLACMKCEFNDNPNVHSSFVSTQVGIC